jgi:excisionase family DNA binding protein
MTPQSDLLTPAEAAAALRIGLSTIQRHVLRGAVASIKIGRKRFIKREELDRVLREGASLSAPAA